MVITDKNSEGRLVDCDVSENDGHGVEVCKGAGVTMTSCKCVWAAWAKSDSDVVVRTRPMERGGGDKGGAHSRIIFPSC